MNALRKASFVVRISNKPGALEGVLSKLRGVDLTRIESRPAPTSSSWDVFLDCTNADDVPWGALKQSCLSVDMLGPIEVPWFPRRRSDLDAFANKTLDAGAELAGDHPGFTDLTYRARRSQIVANAGSYASGQIPSVDYTAQETKTWSLVYKELKSRFPQHACSEFLQVFADLEQCGLYSSERIPQLQDLSPWLERRTGFTLRPVAGLLSARDFLNGLAVKTFHSTQYLRHESRPYYTPEPDAVHELMGHVPMLGDPDFAALSHDIGLASLGASESDVNRLATLYWFSVEFGLTAEAGGKRKAYGAGLLSSFGELEHACAPDSPAQFLDWDPAVASDTAYPITTFQPTYFVAQSLHSAADKTRRFCDTAIRRPFYAKFENGEIVTVDRDVVRRRGVAVME